MKASVYVHLPFCKRFCHYCDFVKLKEHSEVVENYQKLLLQEFELWFDNNPPVYVETLYFGGGSPSLYPIRYLHQLIEKLKSLITFSPIEVTLEANPWELEKDKIETWYELGINRLSVGVQNASNEILRNVGRVSPTDLLERLKMAKNTFDILNLDFILGLPGENEETLERNIALVKELLPHHISYYFLDTDHDTPLMRAVNGGKIKLPDEEIIDRLYESMKERLSSLGYDRYEISSWQRSGMTCKHNLNYWKNGNYIGFGLSAGGHFKRLRYVNTASLENYEKAIIDNEFPREYSVLNNDFQEDIETLFMGLRLSEGVYLKTLTMEEHKKAFLVEKMLEKLDDFVEYNGERIYLNETGMDNSRFVFEKILEIKEEMEDVFGA